MVPGSPVPPSPQVSAYYNDILSTYLSGNAGNSVYSNPSLGNIEEGGGQCGAAAFCDTTYLTPTPYDST
jgi:hypothetical protein